MINKSKLEKVFIIAEVGVNHNGKIQLAMEMIKLAKKAGADCVKFQAFSVNRLVSKIRKCALKR